MLDQIGHPGTAQDDGGRAGMQRMLEGSSLETICQMVAAGAGVTVVPATMPLNDELAEHVVIRPFTAPAPSRTVAIFYRRGFARPELINCIAEVVRGARLRKVRYSA